MRFLWIGRYDAAQGAGDFVYDRRTIDALRRMNHVVEVVTPVGASRLTELRALACGLPYYRGRFFRPENRERIVAACDGVDAVICSWEPFDFLALDLPRPTALVLHNITSRSLPSLAPGNPLARLAALHARSYEAKAYTRAGLSGIALLSRRDEAYVRSLHPSAQVVWTPPGMPPVAPLDPQAGLRSEIVISGNYDWKAKRRDIIAFFREYAALEDRLPILSDDRLPEEIAGLLPVRPTGLGNTDTARESIRIGLIPDRFEAGHKLKTLYYIANNCIVMSLSDVDFDFTDVPDHEIFIRRIHTVEDIARERISLAAMAPTELNARFATFKERCRQIYTWDNVARTLSEVFDPEMRLRAAG